MRFPVLTRVLALALLCTACLMTSACSTIKGACDGIRETYDRERAAGQDLSQTLQKCLGLKGKEEGHQNDACPTDKDDGGSHLAPQSNGTELDALVSKVLLGAEEDNFDGAGSSLNEVSARSDSRQVCSTCAQAAAICASLGVSPSPNGPLARCCSASE